MLAARLPGLLPPMEKDEALASDALQGLAAQGFDAETFGRRPYRAPHHSSSAVAHGGVLFLDELPELPRAALEALREPLESGHITISQAARGRRRSRRASSSSRR